MALVGTKRKSGVEKRRRLASKSAKKKVLALPWVSLGSCERAAEAATERVVGLVRLVPGVPDLGVEGIILQIFEGAAVKLIAATLGGDGDIPELREFGVVVELRDLEFADEFGGWVHVAERAVLANVHGGRAVDGILHLGRKPATHGNVAVGVLLRARNGGEHGERAGCRTAVVHGKTGNLLEILGVADRAVFGIDHRTGFAADFDGLRGAREFEKTSRRRLWRASSCREETL